MERFKKTFSFRKKKDHVPEASKPHQWQEDEKKVRDATCSFQVRYLGYIEVFESRGIQVCEEAVKALKSRQHRTVWSRMSLRKKKSKADQQCKGKYQRAILYVSGDALRVVDEISKGLIVDQTIEKVSFCAPDRNQEKGFAYICRDGTTRRWMCHGFLAVKESGERLSHAVGCAFAICLEKKQKREKDAVTVTYNDKGTSFSRMGSFRQATLTERMQDPQSVILAEPVEQPKTEIPSSSGGGIDNVVHSVAAVQRPKPSEEMLQRQASFRGFSKLSDNSPFKRQMSLRLNELPSNLARQDQLKQMGHSFPTTNGGVVEAIAEVSPSKEADHLSDIRHQIEGLSAALNTNGETHQNTSIPHTTSHNITNAQQQQNTTIITQQQQTITSTGQTSNIPTVEPIRQTNPWETPPAFRHNSPAESWLQSASSVSSSSKAATSVNGGSPVSVLPSGSGGGSRNTTPQRQLGMLTTQPRSQTVDTGDMQWYSQQKAPTLRELQQRNQIANFQSNPQAHLVDPLILTQQQSQPVLSAQQQQQLLHNQSVQGHNLQQNPPTQVTPPQKFIPQGLVRQSSNPAVIHQSTNVSNSIGTVVHNDPWNIPLGPTSTDPFDAAWATKSPNTKQVSLNPFHSGGDTVTQTFKVQL